MRVDRRLHVLRRDQLRRDHKDPHGPALTFMRDDISRAGRESLYWSVLAVAFGIGVVVVLPFYLYEIPSAGDRDLDVKKYWPFGLGGFANQVAIWLSLSAPLLLPSSLIWSVRRYFRAKRRKVLALVPAAVLLLIGFAFLINWRAILEWHLD